MGIKDGIILMQQNYSGLIDAPKNIGNCYLNSDHFINKSPKIFGVKIAKIVPGYAFAEYHCK